MKKYKCTNCNERYSVDEIYKHFLYNCNVKLVVFEGNHMAQYYCPNCNNASKSAKFHNDVNAYANTISGNEMWSAWYNNK